MQPTTLTKGRKEVKFNHQISVGVEVKDSKVTGIWPSSELLGVVYVGDTIVSVNGMPTPYTAEFVRAVNSKLPGSVVIEYMRDEMCTIDFKQLPPKKQGYDLFEVTLIWRSGGTPIGLLIHRDFSGRVVVAMVESGCTASKVIKAGDVLVKVNSTEVKDRDIARKLIVASINTNKRVVLTLERCTFALMPPPLTKAPSDTGPQGAAAPSSAAPKPALTAPAVNTKLDVVLPADVLAILEANKNFFLVKCTLPPCLKKVKSQADPNAAHMDLPTTPPTEAVIPYDPSPKPLKITPKRLGS